MIVPLKSQSSISNKVDPSTNQRTGNQAAFQKISAQNARYLRDYSSFSMQPAGILKNITSSGQLPCTCGKTVEANARRPSMSSRSNHCSINSSTPACP